MADGIEAVTTATLALALDAASLRQQAIAANIANHATERYTAQRLDFAAQMEDVRRTMDPKTGIDPAALAAVHLQLEPVLGANGQPAPVQLDVQMADMAQNAVQYQVLARTLNRHFSILASAVSEGKR